MTVEALRKEVYYTYADYCTWDDSERWELIDGVAYAMSPAPSWGHQDISGNLLRFFLNFLYGKECKVFHAPFDVRLNADKNDDTVVQPDIVIICDRSKLQGTGCVGAPDMVVEILSPSTSSHDRVVKFQLYEKAGIREYWIVDPEAKAVIAHVLENGRYNITIYTDMSPSRVLEGCEVDLSKVFTE
jgi:Uma2 family endonuclease